MELKQSAQEYEIPHQLTYYECDELDHPTLSMVMSMLSVVADEQSNKLGLNREVVQSLSLIHISEPTRPCGTSRMPSSA